MGYNAFARDKAEGAKSSKYKACGNDAERAEYRKAWAAKKLKNFVETKTHVLKLEEIHEHEGEYLSFDSYVAAEGGAQNPENVKAAYRATQMCIKLGGQYLDQNEFTGRTEPTVIT